MRIEISLEKFIEIYRLASLGTLIHGVVHNLNGPLQNLGMDMEMMGHAVTTDKRLPEDLAAGFLNRLRRMEKEFDHINGLIKSASMRVDEDEGFLQCRAFKDFVEQEFSFLHANLYFKHNVRKDLRLSEDLPPLRLFPQETLLSLSWLIQSIVAEIEKSRSKALSVAGRALESSMEISFIIEGEVSPKFIAQIGAEAPCENCIQAEDAIGLRVSLSLLKLHGATVTCRPEREGLTLVLDIPIPPIAGPIMRSPLS